MWSTSADDCCMELYWTWEITKKTCCFSAYTMLQSHRCQFSFGANRLIIAVFHFIELRFDDRLSHWIRAWSLLVHRVIFSYCHLFRELISNYVDATKTNRPSSYGGVKLHVLWVSLSQGPLPTSIFFFLNLKPFGKKTFSLVSDARLCKGLFKLFAMSSNMYEPV